MTSVKKSYELIDIIFKDDELSVLLGCRMCGDVITTKAEHSCNCNRDDVNTNSRAFRMDSVCNHSSPVDEGELVESSGIEPSPSNNYFCGNCSASFMTIIDLQSHLRSAKNIGKICERCDAKICDEIHMFKHMYAHNVTHHVDASGESRRKELIPLKSHTERKDDDDIVSEEDLVPWNHDSVSSDQQVDASDHKSGDYRCHCGKLFKKAQQLRIHSRIHTGVKPFGCSVCDMRFSDQSALISHKRVHTGEKPYVCSMIGCGRSFAQSGNLRIHMRRHTGEKPYKCSECNEAFMHKSQLNKHSGLHRATEITRQHFV